VAVDVRLADLDEPAEGGEAPDTLREESAGQRIEDDVDAERAGHLHDLVVEVERPRIEDVLNAHLPQVRSLLLRARRRDHRRAGALRQLDRRATDAAGR